MVALIKNKHTKKKIGKDTGYVAIGLHSHNNKHLLGSLFLKDFFKLFFFNEAYFHVPLNWVVKAKVLEPLDT